MAVRRTLLPAVVLTAAVLAGCGGDGDASSSAGAQAPAGAVDILAQDISFPEDTYRATAGTVGLSYRNEGSIPHTLVIEGVDGFKLEVTGNGDEDQGTAELDAGRYTIYCDVAGHREAGMEATLEVG